MRSDFDDLLLKNAASNGVKVFEETKVINIEFMGDRPSAAQWQSKSGAQGTIAFDYLVDASGREGIMSTKYLKNRVFTNSLKNIAFWGYWRGGMTYGTGTAREGAPVFEALTGLHSFSFTFCNKAQLLCCRRNRMGVVYPS